MVVKIENKAKQYYERMRLRQEQNSHLSGIEGYHKVWEAALNLLDYKDYSSGELITKLKGKGYPIAIIREVLKRLEKVGLINDLSYARSLLRSKFYTKGVVGVALRTDLMRKSIPPDLIDKIIQEIDESEIAEKAEEMVQKKLRSVVQVDFQKQRNRLISMLLRKGYPHGLSYEIVDNALEQYRGKE